MPAETSVPADWAEECLRILDVGAEGVDRIFAVLVGATRRCAGAEHHVADPALETRLLGVNASALVSGRDPAPAPLSDGLLLGALFESLVTLSVRVYAQTAEATVHHLRTRNDDHEIDLVVARDDGRVVVTDVKLSPSVGPEQTRRRAEQRAAEEGRSLSGSHARDIKTS